MQTDYVQRFLFENLDIRGRLVCLTGAWQRMLDGRGYPEDIAALLGHTTALNVLLGANQKGSGRVTLQVQGSGPVKLLVSDCTAELRIRGMASFERFSSPFTERSLLGNGRLSVTLEAVKSGQFYQSLVPLEGETLEQIFEHYLAQSEQTTAFLRLKADAGALCGLLLEKLPKADTRDADARRDARRAALRPAHAHLSRGADARVPPLCGRVPLPVRRRQGEGHAARARARGSRIDPRRAGRSRDPQRDVQPRVPLRCEKHRRAFPPPLKSHDSRLL